MRCPNTPFATRLSGNAKETQLRICSIAQWKKKRPPIWSMFLIMLVTIGCGGLVSCQQAEAPAPMPEQEMADLPESLVSEVGEPITIGNETYHTYRDNRGVLRLHEGLGNGNLMQTSDLMLLSTLENGTYPMNSVGETYGYAQIADFVGQSPDLIAVHNGLDAEGNVISGYIAWSDYSADFSDPAVSENYVPSPDGIIKDARAGRDANWWRIPLYDQEYTQIGTCDIYDGVFQETGHLIRSLERSARTEQYMSHVQPEQKDNGLVLSNHNTYLNPIPYSYLTQQQKQLLNDLPGETYPQNSKGEYYGPDSLKNYLLIEPDLVPATGTEGEVGYYWWEDEQRRFRTPEELNEVMWSENGYLIPLYNSEHEQIGWTERYAETGSSDTPGIPLNIRTVSEIWSIMEQIEQP